MSIDPERARDFAIAAHGFQRYGDRPYVFHLDQVARAVASRGRLYETVAYLHDVLEDTAVTVEDLDAEFGRLVARCVALISDPDDRSREDRKVTINRRLSGLSPESPDWAALVVKVADRRCNVEMSRLDGRTELLGRYAREHPAFRAAAWREEFQASFEAMERAFEAPATGSGDPQAASSGPSKPVRDFVLDYASRWDGYREAARQLERTCEATLRARGIQGIVSSRAKAPKRLLDKLQRREQLRASPYEDKAQIEEDLHDLVGVRVALYFPDDAQVVDALLRRHLDVAHIKRIDGEKSPSGDYIPRFSGYWATHYRTHTTVDGEPVKAEIQVASLIMHAYAHVAHDLAYKPLSGELSWREWALLDQLNGLALAGEVALQQLQKATRARLRRQDEPLSDHFELGAWLTRWIRQAGRPALPLGRVDRLFELLREIEATRPSTLEAMLERTSPGGSVAEQLIERVLLENPTLGPSWGHAVAEVRRMNPFESDGSGINATGGLEAFLLAYREVEDAASLLLTGRVRTSFAVGPKRLERLALSDAQREVFERLRRVRRDFLRMELQYTAEDRMAAAAEASVLALQLRERAERPS